MALIHTVHQGATLMSRTTPFLTVLSGLFLLSACAGVPQPTPSPHVARMLLEAQQAPALTGDQVYEGRVYALDARPDPLFRYERRVQRAGDGWKSTHLSFDPAGAAVVLQSATHSNGYEFRQGELIHGQTGATASAEIAGGEIIFTLTDAGKTTIAREAMTAPVIAGPTTFGYILAHWDELEAGATLPVRFAVLERAETIGFDLEKVESVLGQTTIRMRPSYLAMRMLLAPTFFHFDTASRRILEYTGRVPPLELVNERLRTLDARVAYRFIAADFR